MSTVRCFACMDGSSQLLMLTLGACVKRKFYFDASRLLWEVSGSQRGLFRVPGEPTSQELGEGSLLQGKWRAIVPEKYSFSCNGGEVYSVDGILRLDTYNALMGETAYYFSKDTGISCTISTSCKNKQCLYTEARHEQCSHWKTLLTTLERTQVQPASSAFAARTRSGQGKHDAVLVNYALRQLAYPLQAQSFAEWTCTCAWLMQMHVLHMSHI
ncbi:TPA: hypothetical protein ACH3X2_001353 [Trebouxia sp. C0005]